MVNARFRVTSCELETNHHRDAGEMRRQEDRQGILAAFAAGARVFHSRQRLKHSRPPCPFGRNSADEEVYYA